MYVQSYTRSRLLVQGEDRREPEWIELTIIVILLLLIIIIVSIIISIIIGVIIFTGSSAIVWIITGDLQSVTMLYTLFLFGFVDS